MWKCHKCQKPVYFAERKHSLGYNWHPECLRCEECGKRLNPGQHAEHKGVPYCHVPCYGALFGPQLFGHGTRVESHKSFGQPNKESPKFGTKAILPRSTLESKIKVYNQFFEGKSGEIRCREVNGRYILEGPLRIYWGIQGVIHLKENDDQRTVVTVRKRNSCRWSSAELYDDTDDDVRSISRDTSLNSLNDISLSTSTCSSEITLDGNDARSDIGTDSGTESLDANLTDSPSSSNQSSPQNVPKSVTLPTKLDVKNMEWDELDDLLQVERKHDDNEKMYQTMPVPLPSQLSLNSDSSPSNSSKDSPTIGAGESSYDAHDHTLIQDSADSTTLKAPLTNGTTSSVSEDKIPLLNHSVSKDDSWVLNSSSLNRSMSGPDCLRHLRDNHSPEFDRVSITSTEMSTSMTSDTQDNHEEEVVLRRKLKTGSTAIKRRPGKRLSRSKVKRRCSINGHFYDRETSFFTPPHGSQMSVWVTSLVNTPEVIKLILEKYKVESDPNNFALFIMRDNGEQRRLREDEYPLLARVLLGPHEDVAKLFLMDSHNTHEVSSEVAQFLNLSLVECRAILCQYDTQEDREIARIKEKYEELKRRMDGQIKIRTAS